MTVTVTTMAESCRAEELRTLADGGESPTLAWIADVLRASGSALFDESLQDAQAQDVPPVSGRRVRGHAGERIRCAFSLGHAYTASLSLDTDHGADVSAPDLRAAFDALVEIGDFLEVSGGRIYPSRARIVQLTDSLWGIVSGSPSADLSLPLGSMLGTSVLRLAPTHPGTGYIEQRLSDWIGLRTLDYPHYARDQLTRSIPALREDASTWFVANVVGPTTEWVPVPKWVDFSRPLVVRRRREENAPWERFIARLKPGIRTVECVAARQISYFDCSRILHGQKVALGFGRALRSRPTDKGIVVTCDTHELPEVRRILVALSYDCSERDDQFSFYITSDLVASAETTMARIGIRVIPFR